MFACFELISKSLKNLVRGVVLCVFVCVWGSHVCSYVSVFVSAKVFNAIVRMLKVRLQHNIVSICLEATDICLRRDFSTKIKLKFYI